MKELNQWITWRPEHRAGEKKPAKVPFDSATGQRIDPTDPAVWMSHDAAVATGEPIGFVFTSADPYFFLDIDGCLTDDGWSAESAELVARFPGACVEVSVSGNGLHVFGKYTGSEPEHSMRNNDRGLELYTSGRFVAIGAQATGNPELDCTPALLALIAELFPPVARSVASDWTDEPREDWTGPTDDDELIRKARASSSTASRFGAGASFEELWTCDEQALGAAFPDMTGRREFDRSSADTSLARHLAFWTGCDCERIMRLMWKSELVRDKWDREGWLADRILYAVGHTTKVYDRPTAAPAAQVAPDAGGVRDGYQFKTVAAQVEMFAGCIYVTSRDRVMLPSGQLLNRNQFNAVMPTYEFDRDGTGKGTTRKPWEAFTESMAFQCPVADSVSFEPTLPWDCPIERGGMTYANTYRPVDTPRKPGDPTPFLRHLEKLLPDARDREILTAYMAAVVQHKGVKFQWCPVLQGVEGNGKTMITSVLMHAIGDKYSHTPLAHNLGEKFNAWIQGKLLIGIEDIYVPHERREVLEVLKPLITNGNGIGIRAMNSDEETSRVCANFIINSNHRDAIQKSRGDRRFAVFFTAQQEPDDLARDGMTGDYFPELYGWLRREGFAIVHDFLATYAIPDALNPATKCQRAPETSSMNEALDAARGPVEQQIIDYVREERPGFCGGWVSRTVLSDILKHDRVRISINRQREILMELGYQLHPALARGRTNRMVSPDGRKAELWVSKTHPAAEFTSAPAATSAYETSQDRTTQHDLGKAVKQGT